MIDAKTGNRLRINRDGKAGPYLIVHQTQVEMVRGLLKENGFSFTENPNSIIGVNDSDTVFDLEPGTDVDTIQSLLDEAQ